MQLRLIGFALCPFAHRAATLLHEKGAPVDIEYVELTHTLGWFLAISPGGKGPLLVVDDHPLFESSAINELVDEAYVPRLLPADLLQRARHRAWIEVANDLFAAQHKVVSAATQDEHEEALMLQQGVLGRFEDAIHGQYFDERFGLVDVAVAPAFYKLMILEARSGVRFFDGFPKVEAWAPRLSSRASVVKGVLPDFEARYVASLTKKGSYFARELLEPRAIAIGRDAPRWRWSQAPSERSARKLLLQ